MELDKKAIVELQKILIEEYGKNLSLDQVNQIGKKLINLYDCILNNYINKNESKRIQTNS